MSDRQYAIMFLRFGVLVSLLFAAFWTIWHLLGYQVPVQTTFELTINKVSYNLALSRWWDIPLAFVLFNLYAWILRYYYKLYIKFYVDNKRDAELVFGLSIFAGVFVGLVVGIAVSPVCGVAASLVFSPITGLGYGLVYGLAYYDLTFSLATGILVCLIYGFAVGILVYRDYLFSNKTFKGV